MSKKLVIKESKWLQGKKAWEYDEDGNPNCISVLRNENKEMCCLGFACHQLGRIAYKYLVNYGEPSGLVCDLPKKIDFLRDIESKLIRINDDVTTTKSHKKKKIKSIFAKYDVKVEFVP